MYSSTGNGLTDRYLVIYSMVVIKQVIQIYEGQVTEVAKIIHTSLLWCL